MCKGQSLKPVRRAPYYRGVKAYFTIDSCDKCGFWFTNPQPEGEELARFYQTDDYVSHTDGKGGLMDIVYNKVRNYALGKKYSLVKKAVQQEGLVLDYGAGTGAFLQFLKGKNWSVTGVEPSEIARENAKKKGVLLYSVEDRDKIKEKSCAAITLWHVLEHLPDLKESMAYFNNRLEEKGALFIAVPNHQSYDANYYKDEWAALDVPLHLWHFAKNDIESLASQTGFLVERVYNMPFDSFYVSMLSEKIRGSKLGLFNAFYRGLLSNLKGGSSKNMSSLIYQLRKL